MLNRFRLTRRFWAVMGTYWLVFVIAIGVGLTGLMLARDSLKEVHQNRMATTELVDQMLYNFYETRLNILLAFQHDPDSPLYVLHDHPVEAHLAPIEENKKTNSIIRQKLQQRHVDEKEKELLEQAFASQGRWRVKLDEAIQAIQAGDFSADTMQAFLLAGRQEGDAVVAA